jgi:transcription initiation factor TFIIIB Brf1 subunit/transcription initiation factor TFIIB
MGDKKRCSKCGSTQTHFRLKTNERVCSSCGFVEKLKEEKVHG